MAGVGRHDRGAELDPIDLAADDRQGGEGVQSEDLRDPERVEPVRLGLLSGIDDLVEPVPLMPILMSMPMGLLV
jgi:hypothetical protein